MKIAERPLAAGPVEVFVKDGAMVKAIHGTPPDEIPVGQDGGRVVCHNLTGHVILHAQ